MSKEYQYKKNIRLVSIASIVMVFSLLLIITLAMQILGLMGKNMLGFPINFMMVVFGAALLLTILLSIMRYIRKVGICVSVEGDAIIYKDRLKEKKILFNTISHLKFHLFSSDSWIKIASENNTIQISIGLQNISDFLQELKNAIDQKEPSINYDRMRFFSFFKMAVSSDQGLARMYPIFWKFMVIIILSAVIGAVCAILSRPSSFGVIWWILLSMLWPTICYSYAENIFGRRLVKQIDEQSFTYPPRDIAYEKALYRKVLIFGALIYIVISIVAVFILRSIGI